MAGLSLFIMTNNRQQVGSSQHAKAIKHRPPDSDLKIEKISATASYNFCTSYTITSKSKKSYARKFFSLFLQTHPTRQLSLKKFLNISLTF